MRPSLFIAGLLVGLAGTAWAHVGERVIPIFELTDDDLARIDIHDGSVDDWLEIIGEPTLTAGDFDSSYLDGSFPDPSDMGFRVWLGWHGATGHLYVAMERVDDIYINDFEWGKVSGVALSNHDSSISFEVDGDHSGGVYVPDRGCCETIGEWAILTNQQAQSYEGIAQLPSGAGPLVNLNSFNTRGLWFLHPPYANGGGKVFGEAPTLSVTEFYITAFDFLDKDNQEKSQPSKLEKGKVIGLRISVGDFDEGDRLTDTRFTPKSKGGLVLPLTRRTWNSADFFADAVLVGLDGQIPEVTAVENTSWARIKAAFRYLDTYR